MQSLMSNLDSITDQCEVIPHWVLRVEVPLLQALERSMEEMMSALADVPQDFPAVGRDGSLDQRVQAAPEPHHCASRPRTSSLAGAGCR